MKRPTDNLRQDHALVARALRALAGIAAAVRGGVRFPADDSAALIRFLREFVVAVHLRKEAELVCPAAAMHGSDDLAAQVGDLLRVHDEITELVHSLMLFWEPTADLGVDERAGFADTVDAIRARLQRLAEFEEAALFPVCDAEVPADDQLDWLGQFTAFERERTPRAAWEQSLAPTLARWSD
jgi:hemerythrin-like domain-containing protein